MSNDNDNDWPVVKPVFLTKLKNLSPKKRISFAESFKDFPNNLSKDEFSPEEEKPFTAYNCESVVENVIENSNFSSNHYERMLADSQFNVINSQIIDKVVSERSFIIFNEKNEKIEKIQKIQEKNENLNFSPKFDEFYSKPHDLEANQGNFLVDQLRLNEFPAEELVEAVFYNDSMNSYKINFTIFKIKFEVILSYFMIFYEFY